MPEPARPARVFVFGGTVVQVWPDCVRTFLPDGAVVVGAPRDSDDYRATAQRLGYGTDTLRFCHEHEAVSSWLAVLLGLPESPTLRGMAHDAGPSLLAGIEQDAVMAVQRFANASGVSLLDLLTRRA